MVAAPLFEEHSKYCAVSTLCEKRVAEADERLARILTTIDERVQANATAVDDKLSKSQLETLANVQRVIREAMAMPFSPDVAKNLAELGKQVRANATRSMGPRHCVCALRSARIAQLTRCISWANWRQTSRRAARPYSSSIQTRRSSPSPSSSQHTPS